MEYQFITQSDIQFMGDSMMLKRIASRCNEMIDIGYHSMPIFRIFSPRMDINRMGFCQNHPFIKHSDLLIQ